LYVPGPLEIGSGGMWQSGVAVDEETDVQRLNDRQKTRLLSLGLEPEQPAATPDKDEQRGDLLCDILRHSLPLHGPGQEAPPVIAGQSCSAFWSIAGLPLRELLLDPKTDIAVLRRIKEYAKTLGQKAGSEVGKDVFLAIYLAAIASAMVFHDKYITEHSEQDLRQFFGFFARASWMPRYLVELFDKRA
jgi:hypothetical protein